MPDSAPNPTAPVVSGFGKVPRMGDFVRMRAGAEPVASFEAWIQEAMAWGEAKRAAQWPQIYGGGAIHGFVYRAPKKSKSTSLLAGVFRPSHDTVGRKFPLVIAASIPEQVVAPGPHLLPLVLGDFLEGATHALLNADHVASLADFENLVDRVAAPYLDGSSAAAEYDRWSWHTQLWTAWQAVYGEPYTHAVHAVHTIIEALAPFRGTEAPSTPLSVRVPLGGAGVAAASFWLDVVRRAARWGGTVPSFFWSFDGQTGSMLIQLGDTPPSSLCELWRPDPASDHVCDLVTPGTYDANRILGKLPPAVAEVLRRGSGPVADFLAALVR